jgi:hypothetical protein
MKRSLRIFVSCLIVLSLTFALFTCTKEKPRTVKLELKFKEGTKFDLAMSGKGNLVANLDLPKEGKKNFQINFDGGLFLKTEVKSVSPEGNGTLAFKLDKINLNVDHNIPDTPDKYKKIAVQIDPSKIKVTDATGEAIFDSSKTTSGGMNPAMFVLPLLTQEWVVTLDKTGKTIDFQIPEMLQGMVQQMQPGKDMKEGLKYAQSAYPVGPVQVGSTYERKFKFPISENEVEEVNVTYKVAGIEQFEGMECAVLTTSYDTDLIKYFKRAQASTPMPFPDKELLDKAKATMKINVRSYFALDQGYEPKSDGDVIVTGSFSDPAKGTVDGSLKITFSITAKRI